MLIIRNKLHLQAHSVVNYIYNYIVFISFLYEMKTINADTINAEH